MTAERSEDYIILGLSGLARLPSNESLKFVVMALNKLLEQLPDELPIILNLYEYFELETETRENLAKIISNSDFNFKHRIHPDHTFFKNFLNENNFHNKEFILNFAGDEIKSEELMNHLRLYNLHLYDAADYNAQIQHLIVEPNRLTRSLEIPNLLYYQDSLKVFDRRCGKVDEDGYPLLLSAARPKL